MSTPDVTPLGRGRYRLRQGVRQRLAYGVHGTEGTWVFLDGLAWLVPPEGAPAGRAADRPDDDALAAPMPATVAAIHVEPGQAVTRGDVLIVLEAMKMELAVRAPRDGVVRNVGCRAGELVQPGVPLLDLEPEPREPVTPNPEPETQNPEPESNSEHELRTENREP